MASDSTREVYVITRTNSRSIDSLTAEDVEKLERNQCGQIAFKNHKLFFIIVVPIFARLARPPLKTDP
jgi:hypothetical protein